jgi:uncharacterized Zn finger protein
MSAGWLGGKLFSEHDLETRAEHACLERARRLVDTIDDLYEDEWSVCGTVHDGKPYLAMVHHAGGPLSSECDCSDGDPGSWCEHAVAVGLCYLDDV